MSPIFDEEPQFHFVKEAFCDAIVPDAEPPALDPFITKKGETRSPSFLSFHNGTIMHRHSLDHHNSVKRVQTKDWAEPVFSALLD